MKKYIFVLATLSIPLLFLTETALATSGACSYHGGVDCSAGAAADGNAICMDGTESSVGYDVMDECTNTNADMCDPSYDTSLLQQYISAPSQSARDLIKTAVTSEVSSVQEAINMIKTSIQSTIAQINTESAQQVSQCENLQAQENAQEQNNINAFTSAASAMNPFAHNSPTVQASVQSMQNQYNATSLNCSSIGSSGSLQAQSATADANVQIAKLQLCTTGITVLQNGINAADSYCTTTYGADATSSSGNLYQCGCASGYEMNAAKNACVVIPSCPANSSDINGACIAISIPKPTHKNIALPLPIIARASSTPLINVEATSASATLVVSTTSEPIVPSSITSSAPGFWDGISGFLKHLNPLSWF